MIIDATLGGIVIGNRHSQGGIRILQIKEGRCFRIAELEGGEYVVNHLATEANLERINEIVSYKGDNEQIIKPEIIKNTRQIIVPNHYWVAFSAMPQAIISRAGTIKYFKELTSINESTIEQLEELRRNIHNSNKLI